jgi:hypothetical protein
MIIDVFLNMKKQKCRNLLFSLLTELSAQSDRRNG